ncbi:hypothetical protein [Mycoplasmopsis cynos]|nr:hypothetical protein [Mycoplasmopsis cynos]UWV77828.1 hypothetical protein NW070_02975 [Mycoplasmopsis cynos]UWV92536.1 hypothetical protein NWE57_00075 [Mycoplasmopsis cynos]
MSKKLNCDVNKYAIVAAFLKEDEEAGINDYLNPEAVNLYQRRMKTYSFDVNKLEVAEDIKLVKEWYEHYTKSNTS